MTRRVGWLLATAMVVACGAGTDASTDAPPSGPRDRTDGGGIDAAAGTGACTEGEAVCTTFDARRVCKLEAGEARWVDETCASGWGCVQGACVAERCSDECTLGTTDSGRTCEAWDMKAGAWTNTEPATSLHDRAREYTRWVHKEHLPFGGLADTHYSDPPALTKIDRHDAGDSALWTGTYLASEAWRLLATGAVDARARVRRLVETLHLWFNVSPSPGILARFVRPAGVETPPVGIDCAKDTHHCNVEYEGKAYDYNCHVSRDQYQGVMLGYALAYEALGSSDEPTRALIRNDVLMLVDELMKEREVDTKVDYKGTVITGRIKTRFMAVVQEELADGYILLSTDGEKGAWKGYVEFIPDLAPALKQLPIGLLVPQSVPRPGSAIMLSSFFRIALKVMDGIPSLAQKRAETERFYLTNTGLGGNVHDWLPVAQSWTRQGDECGASYYGNNIDMEPLYNWGRLETDSTVSAAVRELVRGSAWPAFLDHKNTWFSFLTGANMASPDPGVIQAMTAQLAQFPAGRVTRKAVDLLADPRFLPHQDSCQEKANIGTAVDVGERPTDGILWQRDPWQLKDDGDPGQAYTGVDYLSAYWVGRKHDFVKDDVPNRCLRWK